MDINIYIVDDDISIRQILKNIILSENLGNIVGESDNGDDAIKKIPIKKPDIIIVDLLLPGCDGIEVVYRIKRVLPNGLFVMISQVSSKDMVAKAYEGGIEYFISKPINVNEVTLVMKRVIEKFKLIEALKHIESAFKVMKDLNIKMEVGENQEVETFKEKAKLILSNLGILGEYGCNDILEIGSILVEKRAETRENLMRYKTSQLYQLLNTYYIEEYRIMESNEKAIEQRIRRAIIKALRNIASIGLEDYSDDVFITYSNTLFDFQEVRTEMDYLKGKKTYRGKVNVKKFIEGICHFASTKY